MRLTIIGSGYVGLVTAACFAEFGHDVTCVDINAERVEALKKGIIPIFELGLETIVKTGIEKRHLHFTTDLGAALKNCQIVFVAVQTPTRPDGSPDLTYVWTATEEIGAKMQGDICIVNKSTVPVGTADRTREIIEAQLKVRGENFKFDVASVPEFLKEGTAVEDCMRPARVIIGADDEKTANLIKKLYKPFTLNAENIIVMDVKSAEMTKYAANSMLAAKISFMNEIANICERVGADVRNVRKGIGSDPRIGFHFIYPGVGYGGSCLPKDVLALTNTAEQNGCQPELLRAIHGVNERQKQQFADKIIKNLGTGKKVAVWGIAFKPNTDDMRDAPSIHIIKALLGAGAEVVVYDPQAMDESRKHYLHDTVSYAEEKYAAAEGADALVLITEWGEFRNPDFEHLKEIMRGRVIFDGRNQYDVKVLREIGFECHQIGIGGAV